MIECPTRTKRRDPGNARITPRELDALRFVAQAQPVTSSQYARLLGVSIPIARRSLRKLRGLGLLNVTVTSLNEPNQLTLAAGARPVLARGFDASPDEFRLVSGLGRVNLPHHAGAVDLYIALRCAVARAGHVRLEQFLLEHEVRARLGASAKGALVPDAVAVLADSSGGKCAIGFEVDLSTENPSYIAERKGVPYTELRLSGKPLMGCLDWVVCMVVPSERRRNRVAEAVWRAGIPERFWYWAVASEVSEQTILTPIWTTLVGATAENGRLVSASPFQGGTTNQSNEVVRP